MTKSINAPFYTETKGVFSSLLQDTHLPNGYLYSKGLYPTKITPTDLPSKYIPLTIFKANGYLSLEGIKDVVYKPSHHLNRLHQDDFLYISYNAPIGVSVNNLGFREYHNYDVILFGGSIVKFIRAIQQAQTFNIEPVAEKVKKAERLFLKNHNPACKRIFQSSLLEPL